MTAHLDKGLHARLEAAADERDVSVSFLTAKAVAYYLEHVIAPLDALDGHGG